MVEKAILTNTKCKEAELNISTSDKSNCRSWSIIRGEWYS